MQERKQYRYSDDVHYSDRQLRFIAWIYRSSCAFGITHEEWDEMESNDDLKSDEKRNSLHCSPKRD